MVRMTQKRKGGHVAYRVSEAPSDLHSVVVAVPRRIFRDNELVDVDAFDDESLQVVNVVTHGQPSLEDVFEILEAALGPITPDSKRSVITEDGERWGWMVTQPHIAHRFDYTNNKEES